jgi:hypothetical protein
MGIVIAWGVGLGIVTYRWAKAGAPPTPGALALVSGFFGLTAVLHTYPPARSVAVLLAAGIDVAAYLQLVGKAPAGQVTGWPPPAITDPGTLLPSGQAPAKA